MDNEQANIDEERTDLKLSDEDLESVVGGLRQPRGPVKLKALAHRHAMQDSLYQPSNVKFSTEIDHE